MLGLNDILLIPKRPYFFRRKNSEKRSQKQPRTNLREMDWILMIQCGQVKTMGRVYSGVQKYSYTWTLSNARRFVFRRLVKEFTAREFWDIHHNINLPSFPVPTVDDALTQPGDRSVSRHTGCKIKWIA